jgi:hypothetical protein
MANSAAAAVDSVAAIAIDMAGRAPVDGGTIALVADPLTALIT